MSWKGFGSRCVQHRHLQSSISRGADAPACTQVDQTDFFQPEVRQCHFFYKRQVIYCFKRKDWVSLPGGREISDPWDISEKSPREAEGEKACPLNVVDGSSWERGFGLIVRLQWEFARCRIMKGSLLLYFVKSAYLKWKEKLEMPQTMKWKF